MRVRNYGSAGGGPANSSLFPIIVIIHLSLMAGASNGRVAANAQTFRDVSVPFPFAAPDREMYPSASALLHRVRDVAARCPEWAHVGVAKTTSPGQHPDPYARSGIKQVRSDLPLEDEVGLLRTRYRGRNARSSSRSPDAKPPGGGRESLRGRQPLNGLHYVTLTDRRGYQRQHLFRKRARIMLVFGESARDLVSAHVAVSLLEAVCDEHTRASGPHVNSSKGSVKSNASVVSNTTAAWAELGSRARELLSHAELVLVPVANPSGREMALSGGRCEVRNANNVDLNANWDKHWGVRGAVKAEWSRPRFPDPASMYPEGTNDRPPVDQPPRALFPRAQPATEDDQIGPQSSDFSGRGDGTVNGANAAEGDADPFVRRRTRSAIFRRKFPHVSKHEGDVYYDQHVPHKADAAAGAYQAIRRRGRLGDGDVQGRIQTKSHGEIAAQGSGASPFSEHETRGLRVIAANFRPAAYVSVRTSGALGMTLPHDCRPQDAGRDSHIASVMLPTLEELARKHCAKCAVDTLFNLTGSAQCGTGTCCVI